MLIYRPFTPLPVWQALPNSTSSGKHEHYLSPLELGLGASALQDLSEEPLTNKTLRWKEDKSRPVWLSTTVEESFALSRYRSNTKGALSILKKNSVNNNSDELILLLYSKLIWWKWITSSTSCIDALQTTTTTNRHDLVLKVFETYWCPQSGR